MQPLLSESKGPPRTEERPKPALDCESKTTGHPTLPILPVSQLSRPAWPRTKAGGRHETRPPLKCLGRWGNWPLLAAFPPAS